MAIPEEILFANIRQKLKDDIHAFVQSYAEEAEVKIVGLSAALSGSILGHTLQGHDISLEYDLEDSQNDLHKEFLGIRIRHENWKPKVTIWARMSMMETFFSDQLTEVIKEKLRACIDKTITQA